MDSIHKEVMIKEAFVSFEVAKLLKEKGFNEPCLNRYCTDGRFSTSLFHYKNSEINKDSYNAPTCQMAMKWLRTEKYVIIFILPAIDDIGNFAYCYDIAEWDDNEGIYEMSHMSSWFYTYEDAVEAALKYSLENVIK